MGFFSDNTRSDGYSMITDVRNIGDFYMMEEPKTDWISTKDAAKIMDLASHTVSELCRRGIIKAQKLNRDWMVWRADAESYNRSKAGRPRTSE